MLLGDETMGDVYHNYKPNSNDRVRLNTTYVNHQDRSINSAKCSSHVPQLFTTKVFRRSFEHTHTGVIIV